MDFKKLILVTLLISVLLLSGCINIEVEQKLKRNGHYDMKLTISTSQEYKMMLNAFKEDLQVHDSVKNKFEYSETDTSIIYTFKDIDPARDKVLFKEIEKKDEDTDNLFGQTQETPDSGLVNPKSVELKKEFKFPYYQFTYILNPGSTSEEDSKETETLTADQYILDEANIIDEQTKTDIMQSINNIYKNTSIETIIVTKEEMTSTDYFYYEMEFRDEFDFKNKNKQYILIFISTNADGLCKVKSNIYTDSALSSKIRTLNSDFSENCKSNYAGQVKNTVTEIDTFFETHDLESNEMAEQLGKIFKIGYTVDVFGKITETNGMKMGDDKVKFDINPTEEREYRIVFKDFFLATLLGDSYWIYLLVIGIVIVGVVGFFVFSKIKKNQEDKPPEIPIPVNPKLLDYVKRARDSGMTDKQIKDKLIQSGWDVKAVDVALNPHKF